MPALTQDQRSVVDALESTRSLAEFAEHLGVNEAEAWRRVRALFAPTVSDEWIRRALDS